MNPHYQENFFIITKTWSYEENFLFTVYYINCNDVGVHAQTTGH